MEGKLNSFSLFLIQDSPLSVCSFISKHKERRGEITAFIVLDPDLDKKERSHILLKQK